jgi:hypothetical protein
MIDQHLYQDGAINTNVDGVNNYDFLEGWLPLCCLNKVFFSSNYYSFIEYLLYTFIREINVNKFMDRH